MTNHAHADSPHAEGPPPGAHGPLAEEAARLVEAGLDWARRAASAANPERVATGAPECAGCPFCRAVHALREPNPEVAERLTGVVTDLATLVATGLRAFEAHTGSGAGAAASSADGAGAAHASGAPQGSGAPHGTEPGGAADRAGRRRPGVEHIDIA